ncbi:lasso RiPP family leader peptide-containing protein [Streptomyces sp. CRN 30]|nr:lasso RiPP family leader peptide-containing protein [Streptomyces sp. CRN 30]
MERTELDTVETDSYEAPEMVEVGDFAEVTLGPNYVGIWDGYGTYPN